MVRPEASHQRGHFGADGKFSAGTGLDDADALDAADLRRLRPFASAHVHLGVIDAERP